MLRLWSMLLLKVFLDIWTNVCLRNMPVEARGLYSGFIQVGYPAGYVNIPYAEINVVYYPLSLARCFCCESFFGSKGPANLEKVKLVRCFYYSRPLNGVNLAYIGSAVAFQFLRPSFDSFFRRAPSLSSLGKVILHFLPVLNYSIMKIRDP